MDFRDNGTLVLKAETNEFDQRMADLNRDAKELKNTLKEIETQSGRNNAEYRKTKTELDAVRKAQADLTKEMKQMDLGKMTYGQLTNHIKQLQKELKGTVPGSREAEAALKRLGEAEKHLKTVSDQAAKIKQEASNLGQPGLWGKITNGIKGIGTAFQAILALQVVQWLWNVGQSIFNTSSSFEKYEKVLTTALGSEKAAKQSMEAIKKMAKETSFGVDELTDGYVKMVNRGLRPTQKEMTALADLAASQGKTFDQLVEAVLDAQTGENERLKEFGIKATKEGEKVSLSFKGQTVTVKQNEEAVYQALIAMGQMTGVAGQNALMMETMGGKASNLGDVMDSLMVSIGNKLAPVFVFLLDTIANGIEWLGEIVDASDPVVKVFSDMFDMVGDLARAFIGIFSDVFPNFNAGGNAMEKVMQGVAVAFRVALIQAQLLIGGLTTAFHAIGGVVQGGKALVQFFAGDFAGAAASFEIAKTKFSSVETSAKNTFEKIKSGWTEAFVTQPKAAVPEAVFAAKTTEDGRQEVISKSQQKAAEKQASDKQKAQTKLNEMIQQMDAEHNQLTAQNALETEQAKIDEKRRKRLKEINDSLADEKTKEAARQAVIRNSDAELVALREKDNKKALELLAQMEAEHDQVVAKTSLETEESKIREKQRKRLSDIQNSKADEETKVKAIEAINRTASASLEKVQKEYRDKKLKADQEAREKELAQNNFIRDQEQKAENTLYEWKLSQVKKDATATAKLKKEHADTQLRITRERLANEMAAEQAKATAMFEDSGRLAKALEDIENRYHAASLQAAYNTAEEKKKIDADLAAAKAKNLEDYSNMFGALLKGDLSAFVDIAGQKVQGHKAAWQEKLAADTASYEQGAAMATQAIGFLNDLAQARADKAIAEIQRELNEKMLALEADVAVTQSMMDASSAYVQDLKTNEASRLSELQRILSSETATEEEKRTALKEYYSNHLQDMKAAEEQKIEDLQRLANLAKTEDEKRAIEEKIALAKKESQEKIRLAEEEYQAKTETLDALSDFSAESSENMLKDAEKHSERQIKLAEEEATAKAEVKEDLEELIAAENRKARAQEAAEKKKAWKAQQKADIATALVTGAIAVLKALANFFPLNIVLAAVAAVATGVQIARIKSQPEPAFAAKGTVISGSKHGRRYGDAGIALIDRPSGREVGEMEGGEAIISAQQTDANWPLIQRMFSNARTPGMAGAPVMPLAGIPPAFRDGGKFESPYFERGMYLFGTKKRKAKQDALMAEQEAKAAQAEADEAMGEYGADTSTYNGIDASNPQPSTAESQAAQEAAQKQGQEQLEAIKEIRDNTAETVDGLMKLLERFAAGNSDLSNRLSEIRNAVNGVEGAVNASNQSGRLDQLISKISNMKAA